jgi:hypothetical protein
MKKIALFVASLLAAATAATAQVNVDYDHKIDFSQYRTFRFEPGRIVRNLDLKDTDSSLINANVQQAVTAELSRKGLSPASAHADLTVTFLAGAKKKQEVENAMTDPGFGVGWGYPYGRYFAAGGWWGAGWNTWWVNDYEQGTLILDLYDTRTKQLVWRAYAVSDISNYNEGKFVEREVTKALKRFPPHEKHTARRR